MQPSNVQPMSDTMTRNIIEATHDETVEYLVETRRIGTGPNGVEQPNLPTSWWDQNTYDTLDEAVAAKVALNARANTPGDTLTGREFRVRVTRTVHARTVEIF